MNRATVHPRTARLLRAYALAAPAFLRAAASTHVAIGVWFGALAAFLLWPITGGDYPPGVDTPTFLHLSWVANLAVSGELSNRLEDPFWYGGFFYLVYPPLSYGFVGLVSAITPASLTQVYTVVLILAYGALGFSTWFLAREFGLKWWPAALAGVFTLLAYPSLSAVFLWGWFTTVVSMPFVLLSVAFLERSLRRHSWRTSVAAGVFMALATLAHHMTGLAMAMGLIGWLAFHLIRSGGSRRDILFHVLAAALTTAFLILPWAIPFLMVTTDVGFRRELPGNWLFPLASYATNLLDPDLVGEFVYPSYLGIVLTGLALVGAFVSLIEGNRLVGATLILALLLWFSLGVTANPLINHYPLSGLDVGRFQFYMTPFLALLAASAVGRVTDAIVRAWERFQTPLGWRLAAAVATALVLSYPVYTALQARGLAQPYRVESQVSQSLDWLAANSPGDGGGPSGIYAVGFWNWHAFLIPALTGQRIVDGWHDEGADNVQAVQSLRKMAWRGGDQVNAERVHSILTALEGRFVVLHRTFWPGERAGEYWERLEERPDLFRQRQTWGDITVFEVLPQSNDRGSGSAIRQ